MSQGLAAYTNVGTGTLQSGAAGAAIPVVPHASTLSADLVVVVAMINGSAAPNPGDVGDAGDGWVILDALYDIAGWATCILAACIARQNGSSGYAGLSNKAAGNYAAQAQTFRVLPPARFALEAFGGSAGGLENSAVDTALDAPAINQPADTVIDLLGRGYENSGTTTSVATVTNFTERFDTGSTSAGVVLNDRTAAIRGAIQNPLVTSALASARSYRFGLRAMIPIVGHITPQYRRYGMGRRIG